MARLEDASLLVRSFMRAYRFVKSDWKPARLEKPLAECTVGLVTTAALLLSDQPPFNQTLVVGDSSFREIPSDCDLSTLVVGHNSPSFDHTGVERDPNLAFPVDRIRELAAQGIVGKLNHRGWSFMGSLPRPAELISTTAPAAAAQAKADGVDVALLTPV